MYYNFRNILYRVVQNGPSVRPKARRTLAGPLNLVYGVLHSSATYCTKVYGIVMQFTVLSIVVWHCDVIH